MSGVITVKLKKLRFYGFHGLYLEEKKIGAEFDISLEVSFSPPGKVTSLDETIDYAKLYHLVKDEMQKPRELLETLAMEITTLIHLSFAQVKKIDIAIAKLHVPVSGFSGEAVVKYSKEY